MAMIEAVKLIGSEYDVYCAAQGEIFVFKVAKEGKSWVARNKHGVPIWWEKTLKALLAVMESFNKNDFQTGDCITYKYKQPEY